MSDQTKAVATTDSKAMEYIPFGSEDKIKLSVSIVQNLICVKTRNGNVCSERDAIKFMMMCQAKRLNPFEGDAYLVGYDSKDGPVFSLITAHQAFLKRAEVNKEYDGMQSGLIVEQGEELREIEGDFYTEDQTVVGGWAKVFFKNRSKPMYKRIRLERFKKNFGIWLEDAAGMICKCAEADALRSSFPTMLGGLYMREEVESAEPEKPKVTSPIFTTPEPVKAAEKVVDAEVTDPPAETKPAAASVNPSALSRGIRAALKKYGVAEGALVAYACGPEGIVDQPCKSLEEIHTHSDTALQVINDNLISIVETIKKAQAAEEGGAK